MENGTVEYYPLTIEGPHKASELVAQGNYDWVDSWGWITDKRFPIQKHEATTRTIELLSFGYDVALREVLTEFERRSLKRPTYEDALYFGIQHPEEQRKHPIVFFHEPVQSSRGRRILVLDGHARGRYLRLSLFSNRWPRLYVFAAVRK